MWNEPWWRSLLHLFFVAITYGKVSLWLWKSLEFFSSYFVATLKKINILHYLIWALALELIWLLGSQWCMWLSNKPGSILPPLSARPVSIFSAAEHHLLFIPYIITMDVTSLVSDTLHVRRVLFLSGRYVYRCCMYRWTIVGWQYCWSLLFSAVGLLLDGVGANFFQLLLSVAYDSQSDIRILQALRCSLSWSL